MRESDTWVTGTMFALTPRPSPAPPYGLEQARQARLSKAQTGTSPKYREDGWPGHRIRPGAAGRSGRGAWDLPLGPQACRGGAEEAAERSERGGGRAGPA